LNEDQLKKFPGIQTYGLLVIPIRRRECLRDRALSQNEVEPFEIRFVGISWCVAIGFEGRATTGTIINIGSRERDPFCVLDVEISL
jgi:hypothetical protein